MVFAIVRLVRNPWPSPNVADIRFVIQKQIIKCSATLVNSAVDHIDDIHYAVTMALNRHVILRKIGGNAIFVSTRISPKWMTSCGEDSILTTFVRYYRKMYLDILCVQLVPSVGRSSCLVWKDPVWVLRRIRECDLLARIVVIVLENIASIYDSISDLHSVWFGLFSRLFICFDCQFNSHAIKLFPSHTFF